MNELQNTPNNLIPSEDQSAWADLVICRVEVDLPNWLSQLAGGSNWQVYSESEYDHSISFLLRQGKKEAEVTRLLYDQKDSVLYWRKYPTLHSDEATGNIYISFRLSWGQP